MSISPYWNAIWQNAIGCTFGSLLAISVTYLVYKLSNFDHRKEMNELRQVEQDEVLEYFSELLAQVLRSANQQNEHVEKFKDAINNNPIYVPLLSFISLFDFKRLAESQALDKMFFAYTKKFKAEDVVKKFRQIISAVEYLYTQFLGLPDHARLGSTFDHERKEQFRYLHREAYSILGQYLSTVNFNNPSAIDSSFMKVIDDFYANFNDASDIKFYNDHFFVPLNKLCVAILANGNRTATIMQLAELTRDGIGLYDSIIKHNHVLASEFQEIQTATKSVIEKLEELTEGFVSAK